MQNIQIIITVMHKKPKIIQKTFTDLRKPEHQPLRSIHENVDRKCQTPSIYKNSKTKNQKKSLSKNDKERNRSTQRPTAYMSNNKNIKATEKHIEKSFAIIPPNAQKRKTHELIKHKNRPSSTLANARHAKHLEFNLQNLNESIHRNQSKIDQQTLLKMKDISFHHLDRNIYNKDLLQILEEGRKYLKANNFQRAAQCFKQSLKYDGDELETLYLLAICYFHLGNYPESIKYFNRILLEKQNYKKNIYFFLSIAYKRINDINTAIQVLGIAINKSPKYYDALIFRGKLLSKQKKYHQAIDDFNRCIKLSPQKLAAYVSKADCLRFLMQLSEAADLYSEALKRNHQRDPAILLKRAITNIQITKYKQAKQDLEQIISIDPSNSEAYLFKGLVFYRCKNFNDAILSYQQAIKHNSSRKAITKSLYQIAKIKIQLRDFYGASYTLERSDSLDVDRKILQKIRLFTDGGTFLMKKKIKRGVELLTALIKKQNINEYIKPLTYSFRSYGYFCQYKYTHALNDLQTLEKMNYPLDQASNYNKYVLQGVINTQNNKFEQAFNRLDYALKLKPHTSDCDIYKCLSYISLYNRSTSKQKIPQLLSKAQQCISIALQKQESNYNAYYIRACLNYTLNNLKQALQDVQKAIDKSDDHVMKHFYLRAMIYSGLGLHKQCLGDFSNVISLMKDLKDKEVNGIVKQDEDGQREKDMPEAYLNRAKCYLLFGEKKRAFQDLQNYISYKPLDPQIHVLAGKLLFSIGASQDAIKAYSHCANIDKNIPILLQRAKCFLLLKQLNLCLKDMQKIVQSGDTRMLFDYGCLEALRQSSKNHTENFENAVKKIKSVKSVISGDGYIFQRPDYYFYKGMFYFYLGRYEKSLKNFMKCLHLKSITNSLEDILNTEEQGEEQNYQNRIFTSTELQYNIGITNLMLGNKQQASTALKIYPQFKKLLENANRESINKQSIQQNQITPFPVNNRLCSIFTPVFLENHKSSVFRLSFCLPRVLPPEMELKIDEELIQKLNINSTQARPDAPWIKRNSFGVIFTQQLMGCDIDLNTENQQSQQKEEMENQVQNQEENQIENEQVEGVKINVNKERSMEFDNYFNQPQPVREQVRQQRSKLKDLLTLDPQTEARLARLMKK